MWKPRLAHHMSLFLYLHKNNCFHSPVIWRVRNLNGPGIGKWRVQVRNSRGARVTVGVLWYVSTDDYHAIPDNFSNFFKSTIVIYIKKQNQTKPNTTFQCRK